jgi:hypothetical protein
MGTKVFLGGLTIVLAVSELYPSFMDAGAIIMIGGYLLLLFDK